MVDSARGPRWQRRMKAALGWPSLALLLLGCSSSAANQTPAGAQPSPDGKGVSQTQVIVILAGRSARALHGLDPATAESEELLQAVESLALTIEPMHPGAGADAPALLPYFTVNTPDMETAERVIARLQQLPAVEGAYTKPPDELP